MLTSYHIGKPSLDIEMLHAKFDGMNVQHCGDHQSYLSVGIILGACKHGIVMCCQDNQRIS